jgi:hypothetical protein
MTRNKNLVVYLLLNVIISAITMLAVLWGWNQIQQTHRLPGTAISENCPPIDLQDARLPPLDQKVVEIKVVFSPGNFQNEMVVIKRIGEGELVLTGWQMVDENGHKFVFPALSFSKGEINIHTSSGVDSALDLYWGRSQAEWQTGETVRLLDPVENERASYVIP